MANHPDDDVARATRAVHAAVIHVLRTVGIASADLPGDLLQRLVCDDLTSRDLAYLAALTGVPPSRLVVAAPVAG